MQLVGVCDVREEAAEKVAAEAEELLGTRPRVFTDVEAALASLPDLHAADVVTQPRSHDDLVVSLLEAGVDVICEKPLGLTVARGRRMVEAAERTGRILAVAENNKRDPMNRLGKACVEAGLIGKPNFVLQVSISLGGRIVAKAWRHRLAMGGVLLDVAIHLGYILEYLLGPIEAICAQTQLVTGEIRGKEFDGREAEVVVDAEDVLTAALSFASGTQGHWTSHFASTGETMFKRLIIGSEGTMDSPTDRSGQPVVVQRGAEKLTGETLLAELPDYCLNDIETRLFGERPASYSFEWAVTDRKLIAAEMHDFFEASRTGKPPETDGAAGLRAVAVIYTALESSLSGAPVRVEDVLSGRIHAYQDKVEAAAAG
jgi:predicted dehydrogenase